MSVKYPVFIVGPSRSGTALVRSALNQNPAIHVAGETHYFDDLRPRLDDPQATLGGSDREVVRDYFLALAHRPFGHKGQADDSRMDPAELDELAEATGGSADAYFEAYCRISAAGDESSPGSVTYWGEKTPRHAFRIDDMLLAYPDAHVVALVRDPRAVVASYAKWRNQGGFDLEADQGHAAALEEESDRTRRSFHPVIAAMMCKGAITAGEAALATHGPDRVSLVRYETLTEDPEPEIRRLCDVIGLDYRPEMLDTPMHNSSFAAFDKEAGIRRESVERWRSVLTPTEIATVQLVCRDLDERWHYEPLDTGTRPLSVAVMLATTPVAAVRAGAANKERIASLPDYVMRRVLPGR